MHKFCAGGELNLSEVARQRWPLAPTVPQSFGNITCIPSGLVSDYGTSFRHFLCWRPNEFRGCGDRSLLYRRGWTLQDRLFLKQTIHSGHQLYWEYAALRASNTLPIGMDYLDQPSFFDDFVQILKTQLQTPRPEQNKANAAQALQNI
jgi:hypothetical protein